LVLAKAMQEQRSQDELRANRKHQFQDWPQSELGGLEPAQRQSYGAGVG
jgi:hypothetical protein